MSTAVHDKLKSILHRFASEIIGKAAILEDDIEQMLYRALTSVPRHLFVDEDYVHCAYKDVALPAEFGQVISKPSVVVRMISLIPIHKGSRVLEIGSGTGYTAALLASMGANVYGLEEQGFLAQKTRKRLDGYQLPNILIAHGDGLKGWKEHAPFDGIFIWTPIRKIDAELFMQLMTPGGKLVAPVGDDESQVLHLWEAREGGVRMTKLERVVLLSIEEDS